MTSGAYRGSRKHVLDWVESPAFLAELEELLKPVNVVIPATAAYMPSGYAEPKEARLDSADIPFGALKTAQPELQRWWLVHHRGANTPNWDLVVSCEIEGRPGLVLVEAKANHPELKEDGKLQRDDASPNSAENHDRIGAAIAEAREGLKSTGVDTAIDISSHYQLANRVAFMWKLAQLGIPTILVYLGFTGDEGIRDAGDPFANDEDWRKAFDAYSGKILPAEVREGRRLKIGGTPAWLLIRSRAVLAQSPPKKEK
jgi:hypothetical protein